MSRRTVTRRPRAPGARGTAIIAVVIVLIVIDLIVVSITLGLSRDHDLTIRRLETIQAAYAAEAGVNMAIRELLKDADQDGDGTVGEISDDSNDATDPTLGSATFHVSKTAITGGTRISSYGKCGQAIRKMEAEISDS